MDEQKAKEVFTTVFNEHQINLVGFVDYDLALPEYQKHAKRYQTWVANGSHGEMEYLKRGLERRLNPKLVFDCLESVIVVAIPYPAASVTSSGSDQIRYARYLSGVNHDGADYHETMKASLETVMAAAAEKIKHLKYKVCVDTSAVLERTWASLCGLGWIGKNTLFIHPQYGSYLFLGVVFTNLKLNEAPKIHPDYCGKCTRCLDICPTGAFVAPHYLESRDCISYLTLEKRGEWDKKIDTKGFVAGCDLCQEVCPFNLKVSKSASAVLVPSLLSDIETLKNETEAEYQERVKDSALSRIKYKDFKRNLLAYF